MIDASRTTELVAVLACLSLAGCAFHHKPPAEVVSKPDRDYFRPSELTTELAKKDEAALVEVAWFGTCAGNPDASVFINKAVRLAASWSDMNGGPINVLFPPGDCMIGAPIKIDGKLNNFINEADLDGTEVLEFDSP